MEISQIKTQLTIQMVLDHYDLTPDKNNRLLCPWHNDKTPSLQIYPKTNTWTCFSSNCDAGSGDVIDMIQNMESARGGGGCTKHEAFVKATELCSGNPKPNTTDRKPSNPQTELSRIAILTKYYQSSLSAIGKSKRAMEYAKSRCLDVAKLGIGYSGADIGRKWNENLQVSAERIGVLKKGRTGSYSTKIKYCLLFAMKNKAGHVVDVYGRSIFDTTKGGQSNTGAKHFYLSGTQQGLYPQYPKSDTKTLILTESLIDAATLKTHIPNISHTLKADSSILSLYGTNGFTEEHRQAIKELNLLEEVILFFDGDEAGSSAIKKWTPEIQKLNEKLKISYVNTPKDEDVNSLAINHPDQVSELFVHLIKERKEVNQKVDFLFSSETTPTPNPTNSHLSKPTTETSKLDTTNTELLTYTTQGLKITVLGGIRITGLDRLRVTLKVEKLSQLTAQNSQLTTQSSKLTTQNCLPIRHSLDLYHAKQVDHLCEMIAEQLNLRSSKATQIISQMTTALEVYRQRRLEAMKPKTPQTYQMTPRDRDEGMSYLKDSHLMLNTSRDIRDSGIVGEEKNALIGYMIYLSRKRDKPLHVMYLGSSGSGKTHIQEGLALLIPLEDRIEATSLSDQALYYEGLKLKGKILFIEDIDGAENIMYIIRELQSKGRIIKRVAWRDNKGHTQTIEVVAEGPVVISSCTTREILYEDNANRCILLYIDEGKDQDKKVMDYIKAKSTGKVKESDQEQIRQRMQNVQRLLRPIQVYNPYADLIDLPGEIFKPRRSLPLLLGFIETVTFYHQYQREVKTDDHGHRYIQSTYEDIQISFDLLKDVLFNKSDELSNASRTFLERLKQMVKPGDTFYTKKIRKDLRMNASNLKRYMIELQRYGYIKSRAGNRYRGYEYEINDYGEYEALKSSIDSRLEAILLKIREISGPVVQSGSNGEMDYLSQTVLVS